MIHTSWYKIVDEETSIINTINEISISLQQLIDSFSSSDESNISKYTIYVDKSGKMLDLMLGWKKPHFDKLVDEKTSSEGCTSKEFLNYIEQKKLSRSN